MMVVYRYRAETQAGVCELFNDKYPERSISRSVVSKIGKNFGHVKDNYKTNHHTVPEKHLIRFFA